MPPADDRPEKSLLDRALGGDRGAAEQLISPFLPRLEAFVARRMDPYLKARESVVDMVQSTFREILQDLPQFTAQGDSELAFRKWLYRTALRKLQDRRRYYRRAKRDVGRETAQRERGLLELYRTTATPGTECILEEDKRRLCSALDRLRDNYREVLQWVYFEGLSNPEIAARLGKSTKAVSTLRHRALARLARIMDQLR